MFLIKENRKNAVILLFILAVLIFSAKKIYGLETKPQVIFINQVRGENCCSQGSLKNLKRQVIAFEKTNIPAYFTLRYDAITNKKYVYYLKKERQKYPKIIHLGIMIEIIPQLTKEAKITYHDTKNHWFEAQNMV